MSITTNVSDDGNKLVIIMDDKFDYVKAQDFRAAYEGLPETVHHIEINLAATDYMDSSALGMLLNMQKSLNHRNLTYSISHCRMQVARVLQIARFDKKFDIS